MRQRRGEHKTIDKNDESLLGNQSANQLIFLFLFDLLESIKLNILTFKIFCEKTSFYEFFHK